MKNPYKVVKPPSMTDSEWRENIAAAVAAAIAAADEETARFDANGLSSSGVVALFFLYQLCFLSVSPSRALSISR